MRQSISSLYSTMTEAGIQDPGGFPLRAVLATIAHGEGADPNAWVEHDAPASASEETRATAPPSSGLFQIHRASWPEIYENTERVRAANLSDRDKMLAMTILAKPIAEHMLKAAFRATEILKERGIRTSRLNTALFVDAAWQSGAEGLARWARRTRTGDPREIVNPERTIAAEITLRSLAGDALDVMVPNAGYVLAVLAALGLAAYALFQWKS